MSRTRNLSVTSSDTLPLDHGTHQGSPTARIRPKSQLTELESNQMSVIAVTINKKISSARHSKHTRP